MIFFTVSNLFNFIVTFTLPYLLNEPAWLGSQVGFIFGSIAALGLFWGVFWMPELANKTLEDIDEMFEAGVPAWRTRRKSTLVFFKAPTFPNCFPPWPPFFTSERDANP